MIIFQRNHDLHILDGQKQKTSYFVQQSRNTDIVIGKHAPKMYLAEVIFNVVIDGYVI
jgi:hypothetical protein